MYQYVLAQEDKVPIIFEHKEKFSQEEILGMFDSALIKYHAEGKTYYNQNEVAVIMKKDFGFEDAKIESIIISSSHYPGLFGKGKAFQRSNKAIQTPFDYNYWKKNKLEK